jgi:peptidoglycan/xylan/chitin deacetylase (PgdA/CDA1 family)
MTLQLIDGSLRLTLSSTENKLSATSQDAKLVAGGTFLLDGTGGSSLPSQSDQDVIDGVSTQQRSVSAAQLKLAVEAHGAGVDSVELRKNKGVLLHDFTKLDKLRVGGIGASIGMVEDTNGNPCVRFTAGTSGTSTLDIELPIQAFKGLNEDGTDFDGLGLMFYVPTDATLTALTVFFSSDNALPPTYPAGSTKSRAFSLYDGKFNNASPPAGGWNWFYIRKQDLNVGTLDMDLASNQFASVRISIISPNSGYIDLRALYWNLPKPVSQAVITFDDAYSTVYTVAFPYMEARGIKGTVYIVGSLVGTPNYLSLTQLQTLYAAGWDICNHTYTHLNAASYTTPAQVRTYMADVARNDKFLADNGFHRGRKHFAYPNGECVPGIHDVAIRAAGFETARVINSTGLGTQHLIGCPNQWTIPAKGVISTNTVADLTVLLDHAEGLGTLGASGRSAFTYFHELQDLVGNIYWAPAKFQSYIDNLYTRIQAGKFEAKTVSEWAKYALSAGKREAIVNPSVEIDASFGMTFDSHDADAVGSIFLSNGGWNPQANGSNTPIFEESTFIKRFGTLSLKQGNIAGASTSHGKFKDLLLTHDLTNVDGFTIWVYCDGPIGNTGVAIGSQVLFAVGDASMTNSSYCNILGVAGGSWRRGWNNVRVTKSDFSSVLTGTGVNWASVKRLQIRFTPNSSYTGNSFYITDIFVGGFAKDKKAPVVLTFDDSHEESLALMNIANSFGIPCTTFTITQFIGAANYQSLAQLKQLYQRGNAICCHEEVVNGFAVTPQLMLDASNWLKDNGFTREDMHLYVSYPNGAFNQAAINFAKANGIRGARSILGINRNDASSMEESISNIGIEPVANGGIADPYKINSVSYTSAAAALAYVDRAIAAQAGITFYGHTFTNITQAEMYTFCAGLKTRMAADTIECMTFPQFCQTYSDQ